jgi:hypothetical protein
MRKITFLAMLIATLFTNGQIILSEDFEGSSSLPETWENDDIAGAGDTWAIGSGVDAPYYVADNGYFDTYTEIYGNYAWFDSANNGTNNEVAEELALTSPAFDCSGLSSVVLSFSNWFLGDEVAAGTSTVGAGFVEVSNDGGTSWTTVTSFGGQTYGENIIDITDEVGSSSSSHVRFRWTGNYSFFWAIDNIIVQQPEGSAPDVCTNMTPANEATDVEIVLSNNDLKMIYFSWDAATTGDPATSYNWYFGTTADDVSNLVSGFDGTAENSGITWGDTADTGWQTNTTYYWKVASINTAGITESSVYSFTTGSTNPLGIEDISVDTFSVSPNPVKDIITINSSTGFDTIKVFNQLGQLVIKSNSKLMDGGRLDLSSLNPGMYLMQIRSDNKSKTVKIIKE